MEQTSLQPVRIGDRVRLKTRGENRHQAFQVSATEIAHALEPVEGMIFSIRNVGTGQLVALTEQDHAQYVMEVIFQNTFNAKYASTRNAPRGSEDPLATPAWRRLQATLRSAAAQGQLYSTAMSNLPADNPLASLLDGWKIVKVWTGELELLEAPADASATA